MRREVGLEKGKRANEKRGGKACRSGEKLQKGTNDNGKRGGWHRPVEKTLGGENTWQGVWEEVVEGHEGRGRLGEGRSVNLIRTGRRKKAPTGGNLKGRGRRPKEKQTNGLRGRKRQDKDH